MRRSSPHEANSSCDHHPGRPGRVCVRSWSRGCRTDLGPRLQRPGPPGRHDLHRRRPVHGQLRLLRRRRTSTSARPPTARARAPPRRPTAAPASRCPRARPSRSTAPASPARWSTTRGSRCRPTARRTANTCAYNDLALVQARPGGRRARSTRRSRSGAARSASAPTDRRSDQVYSYGNSSLRGGVTPAVAEGRLQPRQRRRRLEPHRLHRHARHPRRLGQRPSSTTSGQAFGVLSTVAIAPARRLERRRRHQQGAQLRQQPRRVGHPRGGHRGLHRRPAPVRRSPSSRVAPSRPRTGVARERTSPAVPLGPGARRARVVSRAAPPGNEVRSCRLRRPQPFAHGRPRRPARPGRARGGLPARLDVHERNTGRGAPTWSTRSSASSASPSGCSSSSRASCSPARGWQPRAGSARRPRSAGSRCAASPASAPPTGWRCSPRSRC